MANSLVTAGNGVNPREDIAGGKTYLDLAPINILVAVGPLVLAASDCGSMITNQGGAGAASTRAVSLPPIPATGSLHYRIADQSGLGIEIIAHGSDTIRVGAGIGNVSAAGGNIVSTAIGQMICLRNISSSEWYAEPTPDVWTVN